MGFECSSNIPTSKRFLSAKTLDVINVTIAEQPISPCIIFFIYSTQFEADVRRLGDTTFIEYTLDWVIPHLLTTL